MIELDNRTLLQVDIDFLETLTSKFTNKDIELIITTNEEIQKINNEHRGISKATDVLSFPYDNMPMVPLGSIVISKEFVEQKANELGHSIQNELRLLYIHGLLHLLGFDHEVDNGEMRVKEQEIIQTYNLPKSLIVRTEEE